MSGSVFPVLSDEEENEDIFVRYDSAGFEVVKFVKGTEVQTWP
jgi:hypothetical protein